MRNQEIVFTHVIDRASQTLHSEDLPKYLSRSLMQFFKNIISLGKNKKKLIVTMMMALIWIVMIILPELGISGNVVRVVRFLTCSGGNIQGTVGMIGTTMGKMIFAYFITSLLTGGESFQKITAGIKNLSSGFIVKKGENVPTLLIGAGMALVFYNFLVGKALLINSMMAVTGIVLSLRALSGKAGFFIGLVTSFYHNKPQKQPSVTTILAGMVTGFASSIALSATGVGMICYFVGALLLLTAFILKLTTWQKKGGAKE